MSIDQSYVRHARQSDVPTVLKFIQELAECQNELSCITTTAEKLCETIAFDPEERDQSSCAFSVTPLRPCRVLLAINGDGTPAGMALYFYSYVTWHAAPGVYLEDLYVSPTARSRGHGKRLMNALMQELHAVGGVRIEWRVLAQNASGVRFYKSLGAEIMDGWQDMKLDIAHYEGGKDDCPALNES